MLMRTSEHQDIFYPSDSAQCTQLADIHQQFAGELADAPGIPTLPAAMLLPHGAWQWTLPQLRQGLKAALALAPKKIVLLCPSHLGSKEPDDPHIAWFPSQDGAATPAGNVPFDVQGRDALTQTFTDFCCIDDDYMTEEPACETLLPLLAVNFPGVPVLPIFAPTSLPAAQCKVLAAMLRMQGEGCLFIVSSNMSEETTVARATGQAQELQQLLQAGSPLLDSARQGKVAPCGLPWLEAVARLAWNVPGWQLASASCDGTTFTQEIEMGNQSASHVVWHGVAIHR